MIDVSLVQGCAVSIIASDLGPTSAIFRWKPLKPGLKLVRFWQHSRCWHFKYRISVEMKWRRVYIDGLVQKICNSIANALELRLSCTNPSIYGTVYTINFAHDFVVLFCVYCRFWWIHLPTSFKDTSLALGQSRLPQKPCQSWFFTHDARVMGNSFRFKFVFCSQILQSFAHATTTVLWCHVQNILAITTVFIIPCFNEVERGYTGFTVSFR